MPGPVTPKAIGADDVELRPGQPVGDYVVEGKLGEGGFGTVFRAVHPLIGKLVAIKVLHRQYSAQPEMVSRFVAEARAVNQIHSRHIIDIFSFGQLDDGRHYYVMELLEGVTLDGYLAQRGPMSLAQAVPVLRAVGKALDAAHAKGIAHRDLKPENIFLASDSDGGHFPKLLDFGIAKLLTDDGAAQHKTRTGAPIGTPYYMSPEQSRGKDVDHRTDIYAFGIVAFRMLTGLLPFDGEDYLTILMKQMTDPTPSAAALVPGLPAGVDGVLAWMTAKDPAARPPTLAAAVAALEEVAVGAGLVPAAPLAAGASLGGAGTPSALVAPAGRGTPSLWGGDTIGPAGPLPTPGPGGAIAVGAVGTAQAAPAPTITGAGAAPARVGKRRIWTFVAAASGPAIAAVVAVLLIQRGDEGDGPDPARPGRAELGQATGATGSGPAAIPLASRDQPQPTTTAGSAAADVTGALVTITIPDLPAGTALRDAADRVLGRAPTLRLPRAGDRVRLRYDAPGFEPGAIELTPDRDVEVKAQPRRKKKGSGRPDGGSAAGSGDRTGSTPAGRPPPDPDSIETFPRP
ncbi:MAG: serine/threonine protein kinase [Kofleriaceae bacterium]|nr:serine/threonine protein kinase [Kofleriaceae bacterium]MBP6836775.1 serine/threonine protein kinase [Kofleriaceae bacterium]MBP9206459.1 serine/threonine protein kinase [Kofleriaceae bacterium]